MLQRIWTISTFISFSRIFLLAPLAYVLFSDIPNSREWGAVILILGGVTDFLDGYLARRLHQVTDFGKIIDPIADKCAAGGVSIMLVLLGSLPLWFLVVIVARDLLILAGGIYIKSKKNIITQSNWPGKVAVTSIAIALLLSDLQIPSLEGFRQVAIWTSVFLMALSFALYVQRLFVGTLFAKKGSS
jgi:cardiolipin synthase (CMP-forming)